MLQNFELKVCLALTTNEQSAVRSNLQPPELEIKIWKSKNKCIHYKYIRTLHADTGNWNFHRRMVHDHAPCSLHLKIQTFEDSEL